MRRLSTPCFFLTLLFCTQLHLTGSAFATMPVPSGQQTFVYQAVPAPVLHDTPAGAYPIGIGTCAAGGSSLDIRVGLSQSAGPVDLYFVFAAPDIVSELFLLTPAGALQPFSKIGLIPWKEGVTGPVSQPLFGDIPLSLLPASTYYFALLVSPAGDPQHFTLWATSLDTTGAADYSGLYYVTLSVQPQWKLTLTQTGNEVSFHLTGNNYLLEGGGTVNGTAVTLQGPMPASENWFALDLTFTDSGRQFYGTWKITPGELGGTVTGTKTPWPTYDVETNGVPRLATADVIELAKISQISKFRSGAGHDYSDDFESCRSMKHYFIPKNDTDRLSIGIYAPLDGTVIATNEDWDPDIGWKGTNVGIQSDQHPAFHAVVMHVDLQSPLAVGEHVAAGQLLGTPPDYENVTLADTAFGVNTPAGYKLVSYFEVMTDTVFAGYQARGLNSRSDAIISKAERDADPLSCEGEEDFENGGNLENWVYLD